MPSSRHHGGRPIALASTALAVILAAPAAAQTVAPALPTVPLHDADCNFDDPAQPRTVPPCTTPGTRTVTYQGRTRQVRNATTDYLIDKYAVQYNGSLAVDGAPVATAAGGVFPFGNTTGSGGGPVDASYFFGTTGQTVNVTASYTGERVTVVPTGGAGDTAPPPTQAYWSRVSNLSSSINAIDVQLDSTFETTEGGEYDFQLSSVNPAAVVNNATALAGRFSGTAGSGAIQFGTLAGTATVSTGYSVTPYSADTGASNTGLLSLYRLGYAVTAQVTTQLDETGLVTPRIAVTQGIALNGSTITGLAAGVDPTDAVNKAQLDAAVAGMSAGGSGGTPYLAVQSTGPVPTASGSNAAALGATATALGDDSLAIGTHAVTETAARAALAIGASSYASAASGVAVGDNATSQGYGAVALGANAKAREAQTTAVGAFASATGSASLALGGGATASGAAATAIGQASRVAGNYATAIGQAVSAPQQLSTVIGYGSAAGELSSAIGATANASGNASVAIGYNAAATQTAGTAIGQGAQATGILSAAVGQGAAATSVNTAAYGPRSSATGPYATALGSNALAGAYTATAAGADTAASASGSTAVGYGAKALHNGSTAVGNGATTTAAAQVVLGATGTSVKVGDIAASTAAQVGPVNVVTVDANGTLGRQAAASPAAVERVQASVDYIAAVTDSQFAELSGRTSVIESRLAGIDHRLDGIEGGVAAAMAMGQAKLVPDANVSMTVAAATYGGRQGFAGSISGRVAEKVYVSGSVSGNTGDKRVGGAVSATFGF